MKPFKKVELPQGYVTNDQLETAYGMTDGYHVTIKYLSAQKQYLVTFTVTPPSPETSSALSDFLNGFASTRSYINYATYNNHLAAVNMTGTGSGISSQLNEIIRAIPTFCREQGFIDCCKYCGTGDFGGLGVYNLNGEVEVMCSSCYQRITTTQEGSKKRQTNMAAGIVGALFGSLIGVAVWLILAQFNLIAGITGFIMVVCTMKGFELLGGKITKGGVIISIIISFVMLAVAEYLSAGLAIYEVYKSNTYKISVFDGIRSVSAFLKDPDVGPELIATMARDLIIGYVFMLLASVSYIKQVIRNTADVVTGRLA